ncbi:MAG: hypothetical protein QOE99_3651 [Actinomycetota bacterium]|jgi:DNA-binding CsgD family transcriptional regulator|nr:hypothetical protein [Actinomycetota bacterium]
MPDDPGLDAGRQLLCIVDATSRLSAIGVGAAGLLGWRSTRLDTPLQDAVHPGDAPRLMLALHHSAADRREQFLELRLRGVGGEWVPALFQVSPLDGREPLRYAVAIRLPDRETQAAWDRVSRLEGHLWRVALEVQAARIGNRASLLEAWWDLPEVAELSERQAEILRRVVVGERIGDMAEDLSVTESTIRNHLSSIYLKFGVHSQAELLSRLMGPRGA